MTDSCNGASYNPMFDSPAAWQAFMDSRVVVASAGGSVSLMASVILSTKDSAALAYGCDVYGIVFLAKDWPLTSGPARGSMITLDNGRRLYVADASRHDSCWHIRAMSRLTAQR